MSMEQYTPQQGMDVYGADGEKVGTVDEVQQDYVVVRKGFFFPEDHYIPLGAIASQTDDGVYLNVTKDQALEQEWNVAPAATVDYDETDRVDETVDRDVVEERDEATIPVHEEELVARRREVDRGDVEVNKRVVAEEAEVDVPVTQERVEVTRRAVDRDVTADDDAFEEGTIEIPVRGEEAVVDKQARVVEEIDIDKTAETHTERVRDTVRREEVDVEGEEIDTDVDVNRDRG